jgi:hypothetical protein
MINLQIPDLPGVDITDIDNIKIDPNSDRKALMDLFSIKISSELATIAKVYNHTQKLQLSKKRFPFPMKFYCNLQEKYFVMGTDSPDFPEMKKEMTPEVAKFFAPFKILCKIADEPTWCSIKIESLDKSVFKFSNGQIYRYGF